MYLLVRVDKQHIEILDSKKSLTKKDLANKRKTDQYWKIEDLEETMDLIDKHNSTIAEGLKSDSEHTFRPNEIVSSSDWNWKKVDYANKVKLLHFWNMKNWSGIMVIHNTLKLTQEYYCCDSYKNKITSNITYALQNGILEL